MGRIPCDNCSICNRPMSSILFRHISVLRKYRLCEQCYISLKSGLIEQIYKEGCIACSECDDDKSPDAVWENSRYSKMNRSNT